MATSRGAKKAAAPAAADPEKKFVSVSIAPDARDAIRRLQAIVTGAAGEMVTLSDAILIAEIVMKSAAAKNAAEIRKAWEAVSAAAKPAGKS